MTRTRAYWLCQLGGWGLKALGEIAVLIFVSSPLGWGVLVNVLNAALGIGITHAYRGIIQWRGWARRSLRALAPRIVAATLVLTAAYVAGSFGLAKALSPWSPFGNSSFQLGSLLYLGLRMSPILLLWSILYFGIHYFWNYREAEINRLQLAVQTRDARLDALKLQINPHFLFNSLNSVRALVSEAPAQAQRMITQLARLLRETLASSKETTVSLADELDLVRTYLELEAVRMEERLTYAIEAEDEAREQPVPPMVVQTLVENGIKHGVARRPEGGRIRVEAQVEGGELVLRVINTGQLERRERDDGVGLQNVRERLQLLFGAEATLTLRNAGADAVEAVVRLPALSGGAVPTTTALSDNGALHRPEAPELAPIPE